jgi:hypothetical protein
MEVLEIEVTDPCKDAANENKYQLISLGFVVSIEYQLPLLVMCLEMHLFLNK